MHSSQAGGNAMDTALLHRALLLAFLTVAAYFMATTAALASTPMGSILCTVASIVVFGNLGRGLATLAIITVGIAALLGKASWTMALIVAVGISTIFGVESIADALGVPIDGACVDP